MRIKASAGCRLAVLSLCIGILTLPGKLGAQVVWENHSKEVYNYLSRMAQKGLIDFDDNIRPLSRKYIANCLDSLAHKSASLSLVENKELVLVIFKGLVMYLFKSLS